MGSSDAFRWLAVVTLLAGSACSGLDTAFDCSKAAPCVSGGAAGVCEPSGFCSFGAPDCPGSLRRYSPVAGNGLAGKCVPAFGSAELDAGPEPVSGAQAPADAGGGGVAGGSAGSSGVGGHAGASGAAGTAGGGGASGGSGAGGAGGSSGASGAGGSGGTGGGSYCYDPTDSSYCDSTQNAYRIRCTGESGDWHCTCFVSGRQTKCCHMTGSDCPTSPSGCCF